MKSWRTIPVYPPLFVFLTLVFKIALIVLLFHYPLFLYASFIGDYLRDLFSVLLYSLVFIPFIDVPIISAWASMNVYKNKRGLHKLFSSILYGCIGGIGVFILTIVIASSLVMIRGVFNLPETFDMGAR